MSRFVTGERALHALVCAALLCGGAAAGQPPPAVPPAAAAAVLSLIDSVRLMLANDPNLVVAESHLLNARGALSIQKGTFDTVVGASVGYTDLRTPFLGAFSERDSALLTTTSVTQELRSGLALIPEVHL